MPPGSLSPGLTIRSALVLGFGLTLGLWLWSGYETAQRVSELEAETNAVNTRYVRAQELLANVRAQILLASVFARDTLLDPDPGATEAYLQRFEETYRTAERSLAQYTPVLDSADERARIVGLRREVDDFHAAMLEVFETDRGRQTADALTMLRQQVFPKREVVLRVSDETQNMNRTGFIDQRAATAALYRGEERRAWRRFGFVLAAGLAIGLLATVYAGRLEGRLKHQRLRDLQLTSDLHELSARLTTIQEDERRTIARELHDEIGQALTAIKMELSLAQRASDGSPVVSARLEEARKMSEATVQTVRNLSHLLHPPLLDDLGLAAALKSYLEGFSRRHGVAAELLDEHMEPRLAPEVETALYRIVQEALTNVAKHARARNCRVYLQGLTSSVLVTIEDDGSGFDPALLGAAGRPRGLGLISIRERAAQLGGTFQIETAPGQGTRLTVEMPARPRIEPTTTGPRAAGETEELTNDEAANLSR